jgi:hypothetical protein
MRARKGNSTLLGVFIFTCLANYKVEKQKTVLQMAACP